jgi:hypothetical protein
LSSKVVVYGSDKKGAFLPVGGGPDRIRGKRAPIVQYVVRIDAWAWRGFINTTILVYDMVEGGSRFYTRCRVYASTVFRGIQHREYVYLVIRL